jgi:CheY-like chemotaxis protein
MKLKDVSILVADDETELRELLMEILVYNGAKVKGVENGKQAFIELSKNKYDVILSDMKMPGGDGIELVKRISEDLTLQKPLLFLCSGCVDFKLDELQKYGVTGILSKPFDVEQVALIISEKLAAKKNN